jgi:CheY-like chemotaxis protein
VGSCFTVSLPLVAADPHRVAAHPGDGTLMELVARRPLHGQAVLLAEDIDVNRTVLTGMLESLGAEVTAVADGQAAIEAVRAAGEQPFALILMDMHMPIVDGMEAVRAIRALPGAAARTPIAALTADATPENRAIYESSGLDDFLTKPVDWTRLVSVATALGAIAPASGPKPETETAPTKASTQLPVWNDGLRSDLETTLGPVRFADLLLDWPATVRSSLQALESAGKIADGPARHESVRQQAHALRGAAANYGFERLAATAGQLRETPDDGQREPLVAALHAEAAAAFAAIDAYLPQGVAQAS